MNLESLEKLIDTYVDDASLKPFYKDWINNAILELATDFDFPTLKMLNPAPLNVNLNDWLWPMPDDYHKKLFRCGYMGPDAKMRWVPIFDDIKNLVRRDHTRTGPYVTTVAVGGLEEDDSQSEEASFLAIDPKPVTATTLFLWYYRKPRVLDKPKDICGCIPPGYHERVIVPQVVIKNYRMLQDQVVSIDLKSLQWWQAERAKGLFGAQGDSIGLINFFAKSRGGPKRTGGRDPVGWNPYRYGR